MKFATINCVVHKISSVQWIAIFFLSQIAFLGCSFWLDQLVPSELFIYGLPFLALCLCSFFCWSFLGSVGVSLASNTCVSYLLTISHTHKHTNTDQTSHHPIQLTTENANTAAPPFRVPLVPFVSFFSVHILVLHTISCPTKANPFSVRPKR